jgi:hypothetical protein
VPRQVLNLRKLRCAPDATAWPLLTLGEAAGEAVGEGAGIGDGNNNGVLAIPPCVEPGARSSTCTLGVSSTTRAPDMLDNVASRGLQGTPGVGRLAA